MSWTAPFSLDVTGVDPDIWYSVLIYNVTDEGNPTAISCTDCHNLTQTHYIFSPDYSCPCHNFTFTVIPYNGAGQGEISQNVTGREFFTHILRECTGTCNVRHWKNWSVGLLKYLYIFSELQLYSAPDLEKHTIQITEGGYEVTVHFKVNMCNFLKYGINQSRFTLFTEKN